MKIIVIAILIGILLLGISSYKLGKNATYYRPCGGGRHNA